MSLGGVQAAVMADLERAGHLGGMSHADCACGGIICDGLAPCSAPATAPRARGPEPAAMSSAAGSVTWRSTCRGDASSLSSATTLLPSWISTSARCNTSSPGL